ncbi:MAG: hypothetical protein KGN36_17975 [Acidobacteriota bacterium]|nr:hypothetical protein [Acidobacteriota bacterium]
MIRSWYVLVLAAAGILRAQQPAPAVAPQAAPQAPSADHQLTAQLMDADTKKSSGDMAGALKGYEAALARVRNTPAIANREEEVLQRLSGGYIASNRYQDALTVNRRILALHAEDCKAGAPFHDRCADALYGVSVSHMFLGQFTDAAAELERAVAVLRSMGDKGDLFVRMTRVKNLGNLESMLGAAQFRAGDKEKAVATLHRAIADLKSVADNTRLDAATRSTARKSMDDAQASVNLLEPPAAKR